MSKSCAKCGKTVYPLEELKCLDKVNSALLFFELTIRLEACVDFAQGVAFASILLQRAKNNYAFSFFLSDMA